MKKVSFACGFLMTVVSSVIADPGYSSAGSGLLVQNTPTQAPAASSPQLPPPGSLQFKGQAGGAPTAAVGSGQTLDQRHLPPVVEAQNSVVLQRSPSAANQNDANVQPNVESTSK